MVLFSCKSADVNILGLKEYKFSKQKSKQKITLTEKKEKSNGIYELDGEHKGAITGKLFSEDPIMVEYALVSFTLKNDNYKNEVWTNFYADKSGNFYIKNLPFGIYKIATTQNNAYLTTLNNISINSDNPEITIQLEIKPIN